MEKIGMIDEAFLLARMGKKKDGNGPTREEFNELVERVDGVEDTATAAGEAAQTAQETAESKQDELESGVNIKTLNGESLLGSGNAVTGFVAVYGETPAADIIEYMESVPDNAAPVIVKRGDDLYTSILSVKQADNKVLLRCVGSISGRYYLFTYTVTDSTWASNSQGLQNILVSGENIKTINGESVLGDGNIAISGGNSVFIAEYGVTEYDDIETAIAADKIIILHDHEEILEGASGYFLVTNPKAEEGTALLNVYGDKSFGQYQIGMGRWVKFWEPLDGGSGSGGVFKAIWGQTTAQELLEAINNYDIIMVYRPNKMQLFTALVEIQPVQSGIPVDIVLNGTGPYGIEGYGNSLLQIHVRVTDNVWEEVDYVRVYPNRKAVGEQVRIGSYNDGNAEHRLFRKVIDIGAFPNAGEKSVAHGITGNFTVTSLSGIMIQANGTALPLPLVTLDTSKMVYISCGRSNVVVQTASDRSAFTGTVTIEYYINS